jgi:hypothetical protein
MSLNTIKLKPQLIADLYPETLVASIGGSTSSASRPRFLGNNEKNIMVIVAYEGMPFLPDPAFNLLTSILSACKLSIADIAIVNKTSMDPDHLLPLMEELEARYVLLFGAAPLTIGLPINFPQFQLQQFNKRTYLYSPTLEELENDKAIKMKLWNCLKAAFGL